jgi:hypothetical protein
MITACFTYQKVTPESAENGDVSEHGFYQPGGWFYPLTDSGHKLNKQDYQTVLMTPGELKDLLREAERHGIFEDSGRWFSSVDPQQDFRTGEETYFSLHFDGITQSTYKRISRVLQGKPLFDKKTSIQ